MKILAAAPEQLIPRSQLCLCITALALALSAMPLCAQAPAKPSAAIPAAVAPTMPPQPESKLQAPPTQAVIETRPDSLTIRADNASLTQTLQRLADKTGMHLEGVSGDQRVFGDFGPGAPRDVLNTLLTGTGYNVVMIGALDNGAPRQLLLSQKKADATSAQASAPVRQQAPAVDDDTPDSVADDTPVPQQVVPPQHGGENGTGPGNMRTPQQMLQQMQQMRQQADQQAAPAQQ